LAQSESLTGQTFARYWMHNGLMKTGTEKMSKSKGNEIVVSEVLKRHSPETLRFLLLSTHYRSPIEYGEERLDELEKSLAGFHRFFELYERTSGDSFYAVEVPWSRSQEFDLTWADGPDWDEVVRLRQRFLDCMDDDFNTGGAVGVLHELLTALNRFAEKKQLEGAGKAAQPAMNIFRKCVIILKELSQILGLFREPTASGVAGNDELVNGLMQLLIDLRNEARKAKNFALADQIRKRLGDLGVTLEDGTGGTRWRVG